MSDRHAVLYWNRATPELYAVIREQAPAELEPLFIETEEPAEARGKLGRAEFLIIADWALGAADIEAAPRLRMVQHQGVGYERVDTVALAARKIPLCLCPAGTATGVGEHTMTLILAVLKQVVRAHNALVRGEWLQWTLRPLTRDLEGKTLGLLGFGRTGRATAQRALGFGVRLLACDPYISLAPEERTRYGGVELVSRERLLRESDVVVCHVPLTEETRHMVDRAFLAQMKPEAYLINISRGSTIDEAALLEQRTHTA